MIDLNKLTVEEVCDLWRECERHLETWFGFSREGKARRDSEFEAATRWRLEGQMVPCCECGRDYPTADLHFHGHVYCPECREGQ